MTHHEPLRGRALAAFALVALIWGSTWLVIAFQVGPHEHVNTPAEWTLTWRFMVGALVAFPVALVRREGLMLDRGGWMVALTVAVFQFFGNYQFVYHAEQYLTSGVVAVLFALLMVPNAVLARITLGTRISGRFMAGSGVALGGIALLLLQEYRAAPASAAPLTGALLVVGALLTAAVANVAQASHAGRRQPIMALIAWAMLLGAGIDAGFAYATVGAPVIDPRASYWWEVGYLAIIGSVVPFPLYFALIRQMGAGRAAYNGVAVPVVAMGLSTIFEGYRWTSLAAGGSMLAMTGLLIALSGRSPAKPSR